MLLRMFQPFGAKTGWTFLGEFDVTLMSLEDIVVHSVLIYLSVIETWRKQERNNWIDTSATVDMEP
jgi:hypothetical protein